MNTIFSSNLFSAIALGILAASSPLEAASLSLVRSTTPLVANLQPAPAQTSNLGAFNIVIVPGATLAGNAPALLAFNRAADQWEARISDPVTVTINADLATLGAGIIGSTSTVSLQASYATIRNQMVIDANAQPPAANNGIVASLPPAGAFAATMPAGRTLTGNLLATKANAKAMGFAGLDVTFGVSDGTITFNQAFTFDYNNADGVTAGQTDFETVAAHEIGHALGFVSFVDEIAGDATTNGTNSVSPYALDLFRFGLTTNNPSTVSQFTNNPRNLTPGVETVTDDLTSEYRMSTGLNTLQFPSGSGTDGRQASHWKADELTGTLIGIMDPTLSSGFVETVSSPDFRALDLIGWDVAVPEPSSLLMLGLAAATWLPGRLRRRVPSGICKRFTFLATSERPG